MEQLNFKGHFGDFPITPTEELVPDKEEVVSSEVGDFLFFFPVKLRDLPRRKLKPGI